MKIFNLVILLLFSSFMYGQDSLHMVKLSDSSVVNVDLNSTSTGNNLAKLNISMFNFPGASLQYERLLTKRISLGASLEYSAKQNFTVIKMFSSRLEDQEFAKNQLDKIRYTSYSFTPEVRFYFGKNSFGGFYIAPFLRYSFYDVKFPIQFQVDELDRLYQQVQFKGDFKSLTLGLSLGAQWKVYKNIYVDWLIVGPHFGDANNRLHLNKNLSEKEQRALSKSLELIQKGFNSLGQTADMNLEYEVNENGGKIRFKNPWLGLRMQVGVGYRF